MLATGIRAPLFRRKCVGRRFCWNPFLTDLHIQRRFANQRRSGWFGNQGFSTLAASGLVNALSRPREPLIDGRLITKQGNLRVQCRKVIELAEQFRFVRLEFYQLLREQITISLSGRKFTFGLRDLRVQRLDGSRQFIELQSQSILLRFKFGDSPGTIVRVILAKEIDGLAPGGFLHAARVRRGRGRATGRRAGRSAAGFPRHSNRDALCHPCDVLNNAET